MDSEELVRHFERKVAAEIFGPDWKPASPLAGLSGYLIPAVEQAGGAERRTAYLRGLMDAVALLHEAQSELATGDIR